MNNKNNFSRPIIVFLFCLVAASSLWGVQLVKEFELDFDGEIQYFIIDGQILRWGGGKIHLYSGKELTKTLEILKPGEGPGDFQVVQKIFGHGGKYYVWDRMLKRMTIFSKDWKNFEIKKYLLPLISAFVGIGGQKTLFRWLTYKKDTPKDKRVFLEQIGTVEGGQKKVLVQLEGALSKGRAPNYTRPYLLYTLCGDTLYYADNREYRVYAVDLKKSQPLPVPFCKRDDVTVTWHKEIEELKWEILRKPPQKTEEVFPDFVPPLFALAGDGDLLVAATNEKIAQGKNKIDFFISGKYVGSALTPLLYKQYLVFPTLFNFPPDIYVHKRSLYTFHYMSESDQCKLIKWKIEI